MFLILAVFLLCLQQLRKVDLWLSYLTQRVAGEIDALQGVILC